MSLWSTGDVITKEMLNQKGVYVGSSAPVTTYAGQLWFDTDVDELKERNAGDTAWITHPISHASRHEEGGADEVTPALHSTRHENGGADEISVAGLSGDLADAQNPKSHATSHKDGGADELDASEFAGALGSADQILQTDGAAASWGTISVLSFTELAGGENHNASQSGNWEDWDLSAIIGSGAKVVLVGIANQSSSAYRAGARKNGTALDRKGKLDEGLSNLFMWDIMLPTECDANRVIEIYAGYHTDIYFNILGYWS